MTLVKMGKRQNEVAEMLHITPAAVTQYIKGKRAKIRLTGEEKDKIANIAANCMESGSLGKRDLCQLCENMQDRLSIRTK